MKRPCVGRDIDVLFNEALHPECVPHTLCSTFGGFPRMCLVSSFVVKFEEVLVSPKRIVKGKCRVVPLCKIITEVHDELTIIFAEFIVQNLILHLLGPPQVIVIPVSRPAVPSVRIPDDQKLFLADSLRTND